MMRQHITEDDIIYKEEEKEGEILTKTNLLYYFCLFSSLCKCKTLKGTHKGVWVCVGCKNENYFVKIKPPEF